jgi:DNA polymerase III alpha subunit
VKIIREFSDLPGGGAALLVEDDDALRFLILSGGTSLTPSLWDRARLDGADGVFEGWPQAPFRYLAAADAPDGRWYTIHQPLNFLQTLIEVQRLKVNGPSTNGTFVHLHTHSEFSALDGLSTIPELVELAVEDNNPALAITDHGVCAGHPSLQRHCEAAGIKPIFGMEAYFVDDRLERPGSRPTAFATDAERDRMLSEHESKTKRLRQYNHLILLAKNEVGLRNLWTLSTEGYRDGFYHKPRVDWNSLRHHGEGLIATTACLGGPISRLLLDGHQDQARAQLGRLLDIFGEDLYVEIQPSDLEEQVKLNPLLIALAHDLRVPVIAAADGHFPRAADKELHKTWLACQTSADNEDYWHFDHSMTELEMRQHLHYLDPQDVDEAVDNTVRVAEKCDARIENKVVMPIYYRQGGYDRDAEKLREMCLANWSRIKPGRKYSEEIYQERFEREYRLLKDKLYCGYFLMVADYVGWAKDHGILVGPGRGSGAGSLIAFLMRITEVDPVQHEILFERFITDGRMTLPDFDCVAGSTELHRDGPGGRTVADLYALVHGRPGARPGECEVCGTAMESIKRGYKGNPSTWLCVPCYKKRHHLRTKGLPSILGRNTLGRLSNQPLLDILYKGVRETLRITVSDGRFIESTPEHRHLTVTGWREAKDIRPGDLLVLMDDAGRRASHTDNLSAQVKAHLVERAGAACELCLAEAPEGESWRGKFEVAHLDYSTRNINNMLFLCTPCHRRMDVQLGTPVVFRQVTRAEVVGEQPVYDVVMGHDDHSWVANGFVTHNCDFPASKRQDIQRYLRQKWGDDHTLRIGTHLRYKSKGVLGKLFSILANQLPPEAFADAKKLSAIVADAEAGTAGLGLSWEALWVQEEEVLEPYRRKYPELFAIAGRLVNRLNSYGRHAAGIVISTEHALTDRLPLRGGEDGDQMISQFAMDDLDAMGYVKFDILTIRTLDTVQAIVDGARRYFDIEVDVYDFDTEYEDPMVWEEIAAGNTLGMFQIETVAGTRLVRRLQPTNLAELSDVGALVRPGPTRSGLTEAYLRRREGTETVNFPDPRMEEFLAPTQGVMIYQEQVMQAAMALAGYDSTEADGVRKILGKKKVDQVVEAGRKFVDGCVVNGMDKDAAAHLWEQMAEFAKYGFGKAHSISYAMITYWTAWWKVHYVVPTLTALLSTVDKERVPEFVKEARRLDIKILPPDINASGRGFRPDGGSIRYGLDSIKGIGPKAIEELEAAQPYVSFEDFQARSTRAVNAGVQLLLARVGAFDILEPNRQALVTKLTSEKDGSAALCVFKTTETTEPNGLACTYDWDNEPRPINKKTLKLLKAKPLPKRCTKGCRRYEPQGVVGLDLVTGYTDKEIREIEQELLGIQLSSTPFDMLPPADRESLRKYAELLDKGVAGVYMVVGTIVSVRKHRDRSDRDMAFFNLSTETTDLDVVVFADEYVTYSVHLKTGHFVVAEVRRTDRGSQLKTLHILDL